MRIALTGNMSGIVTIDVDTRTFRDPDDLLVAEGHVRQEDRDVVLYQALGARIATLHALNLGAATPGASGEGEVNADVAVRLQGRFTWRVNG